MSTPEDDFIEALRHYFNDDVIIHEASIKKILGLLAIYKESIPVLPIYKDRIIYEQLKPLTLGRTTNVTMNILNVEAEMICGSHGIKIENLRQINRRSRLSKNVEARKEFCKKIKSKYVVTNQILRKYLNLDHTTITYYLK